MLPRQLQCLRVPNMIVYVYVFSFSCSDTGRPFLEMHSEIPEIVNMTEGKEVVIPCRVTSPNITVTLKKVKLSSATLTSLLLQASILNFELFSLSGIVILETFGLSRRTFL